MLTLTPFVVIWAAVAVVTLGLALYRKVISASEQDIVFLSASEAGNIPKQQALAARLGGIDKWGKTLTVVTLVLGLALASIYFYGVWVEVGSTIHFANR